MSRLRRIALPLAAAASVASVAGAPHAHAGIPVFADVTVSAAPGSTSWTVCGLGFVDDGSTVTGVWLFELDGARLDGTQIRHSVVVGGASYPRRCLTVPKGSQGGSFMATLNFAAAGTSDVTATAAGVAVWGPLTGDKVVVVG